MPQDDQTLTPEQQQAFHAQLARVGMSPDSLSARSIRTADRPGGFVLSGDPEQSHLPPTMIEVRDLAHLKELAGVPDEHYTSGQRSDKAIPYPAPLSAQAAGLLQSAQDKCELEFHLQPADYENVRMAAEAYVHGNSAKVQGYEALINTLHMPTQMAAFAATEIIVSPGSPLILGPGTTTSLNCASITVEPGGQIIVQTNASITTQQFTVND
jgi:hypothetical protein